MCNRQIWLRMRYKTAPKVTYSKLHCMTWNCPECARTMAKKHFHRVAAGVSGHAPWYFETWTAAGNKRRQRTAQNTLLEFRTAWPRIRAAMHRVNPAARWVRVYEKHRDGAVHMHVITDTPLVGLENFKRVFRKPKRGGDLGRWVYRASYAQIAQRVGLGRRSECVRLDGEIGAAAYLAKYITKGGMLGFPQNTRLVTYSQNWPKSPRVTGRLDVDYSVISDKRLYASIRRDHDLGLKVVVPELDQ